MKKKIRNFFIILGIMFLFSLFLLGLLSVIVWKMDGAGNVLSAGVVVVYILTNFLGGLLLGKVMGQQKFFWGVVIGACYYAILLAAGVLLAGTKIPGNMQLISGGMIFVISGMLGGMIAPVEKNE